jgi:hypothetical protein
METAASFRWLLDGSALVNKSKRKDQDGVCFRHIPNIHGSARFILPTSLRAAKTELNSAEHGVASTPAAEQQHDGSFSKQSILNTSTSITNALTVIARTSLARVQDMIQNAQSKYGMLNPLLAYPAPEAAESNAEDKDKDKDGSVSDYSKEDIASVYASEATSISNSLSSINSSTFLSFPTAVHLLLKSIALEYAVSSQLIDIKDDIMIKQSIKAIAQKELAQKKREEAMAAAAAAKAASSSSSSSASSSDASGPESASNNNSNNNKQASAGKTQGEKPAVVALKQGKERVVKGLTLGSGTSQFRTFVKDILKACNGSCPYAFNASGVLLDVVKTTSSASAVLKALRTCVLDVYNSKHAEAMDKILTAVNITEAPKLPKGTRDCTPENMAIREKAFKTIKNVSTVVSHINNINININVNVNVNINININIIYYQ